ncbi:IMPACT family protein [Hugenholtzia roseola]|uniref:IMPACT family protein n=1 Tax=Hugenholtzia roseola TaxID=1002 RepID=UPI00041C400A|nr:YigZ family protein [Hugenholtzia roseola]
MQNDLFQPQADTYLTIAEPTNATFRDKGSKFLAYAYPIQTETEVKSYLEGLKKQYYDATHHCYAYLLGRNGENWRANDDGEPNHTAGTPILNQIRSQNLTQVLVVVVRYYGGTKLGVSGLIHAYKTVTALALEKAQVVERVVRTPFAFHFDYLQMNDIMRLVKEYDLPILAQTFENTCFIKLGVRLKDEVSVRRKLEDLGIETL